MKILNTESNAHWFQYKSAHTFFIYPSMESKLGVVSTSGAETMGAVVAVTLVVLAAALAYEKQ